MDLTRSALVAQAPERLYALVEHAEDYPSSGRLRLPGHVQRLHRLP